MASKVRLTEQKINSIISAVLSSKIAPITVKIAVFGSRSDLAKKGGDIELLEIWSKNKLSSK